MTDKVNTGQEKPPVAMPDSPSPAEPSVPSTHLTSWGAWLLLVVLVAVLGVTGGWAFQQRAFTQSLQRARQLARGNEKQAAIEYRRYLEFHPADDAAHFELAAVLKRRDPDGALAELRKISPRDPHYSDAVRQAAAIALDLGRDYDALEPLLHLAKLHPDDGGVQFAIAELRFRARDFEAAFSHAKRARECNPQLAEAWLLEAESLDELKRSTEMVEPLETALKLDGEIPQAHLNLAFAYQLVGREDEALKHVQWFLKRFPQSAAAYRTLALVQRARGEPEEALAAVQQSLSLRPNQLDSTLLEVELLLYLRRTEEAYRRIQQAYDSHGAERRVLTLLVRAAALAGRREDSQAWQRRLDQLLAATPDL